MTYQNNGGTYPYGQIGQNQQNGSQFGAQTPQNGPQSMAQQWGQSYRPTYLPGRIVTSERDIFPNEIPMDGNLAVFLQQDLQMVFAKTWGSDGLIHTNAYQLVNPSGETAEDPMQVILKRLDNIEAALKKQQKPYTKKNYNKTMNKPKEENENA